MTANGNLIDKKAPTLAVSMTAFPYTIEADALIERAQLMMKQHQIHHLPVMRAGAVVGVVSDRDIKLCLAVSGSSSLDGKSPTLAGICSNPVYQVDIHTPLQAVVSRLAKDHLGAAVVTLHGKVVGMFTPTDVSRCLANLLETPTPPDDQVA